MTDVLSVVAKIATLLGELEPQERAKALSLVIQASETSEDYRKRVARDRKRRGRDRIGTEAGQKRDEDGTGEGQNRDNCPVIVPLGGRGVSLSSDLDLPLSQRSGEVTGQVSTAREEVSDGLPGEVRGEAGDEVDANEAAAPVLGSWQAAARLGDESHVLASGVAAGTGASSMAHSGNAQVSRPGAAPPRLNPVALVEHFQAGVNEAGGVWTPGGRGPSADLAQALQPWAEKARKANAADHYAAGPLAGAMNLGRAWHFFCGGAPRDAWKAAAWLGEGAPTSPRASPAMAADDAADRARRSREAETRENDRRRTRDLERRSSAPPEALALVASLGRADPPSGVQRVASADEQADELQRLFAAEGE